MRKSINFKIINRIKQHTFNGIFIDVNLNFCFGAKNRFVPLSFWRVHFGDEFVFSLVVKFIMIIIWIAHYWFVIEFKNCGKWSFLFRINARWKKKKRKLFCLAVKNLNFDKFKNQFFIYSPFTISPLVEFAVVKELNLQFICFVNFLPSQFLRQKKFEQNPNWTKQHHNWALKLFS